MTSRVLFLVTFFYCFLFFQQFGFAEDRGVAVKGKLQQESGKAIGDYRALIIGINDYEDEKIPDLETAVSDAESVAKLLKKSYGFTDVTLLLDRQADGSTIQKSLRKLATSSKPDDSVLIYYAGHGDLDKITKDGYWIPSNAVGGDPFTYIGNAVVQQYVKAIPARHVLLVSDSCFSGTLFGEARALPSIIDDKYYANLYKEKSRWGMTSGNLTPVSDNGSAGHSVFAYQFLKKLASNRKSYLTPREIYQDIAPVISNNSNQMPIAKPIRNADDMGGEFIFIRTNATPVPAVSGNKPTQVAGADTAILENNFWDSIKNSSDADLFQAYLDEFPDGTFAGIARIKLKQLEKKKEPSCCELTVRSNVSGDMVYIDGEAKRGTSPTPFHLSPGTYTVEVKKSGYETWKSQVSLSDSNSFQTLQAQLTPVYSPPTTSSTYYTSSSGIRSSDGRYIDHGDGTVTDTRTGLMWTQKDSWADTGSCKDWNASKSYVSSLRTGGYTDWRMPTIDELKGLYEPLKSNKDKDGDTIHLDSIFAKGGTLYYWSSEEVGSCCARGMSFYGGGRIFEGYRDGCDRKGVRAVRQP